MVTFIVKGLTSHTKKWHTLGYYGTAQQHEDNIAKAIAMACDYLAHEIKNNSKHDDYVQIRIEARE